MFYTCHLWQEFVRQISLLVILHKKLNVWVYGALCKEPGTCTFSRSRHINMQSRSQTLTWSTRPNEGLVTLDRFPGLTGYMNCVRLLNSLVIKRCSLIPIHALFTIDHGTGTSRHFRGRLESHDFSNPSKVTENSNMLSQHNREFHQTLFQAVAREGLGLRLINMIPHHWAWQSCDENNSDMLFRHRYTLKIKI